MWQLVATPREQSMDDTARVFDVSLVLTMRSGDMFLGVPLNLLFYGIMLRLMCACASAMGDTLFVPADVVVNVSDAHCYSEHLEAANTYLDKLHDFEQQDEQARPPAAGFFIGRPPAEGDIDTQLQWLESITPVELNDWIIGHTQGPKIVAPLLT